MKELISIIVPVYNAEKYIDKCIKSIVDQTYKNLEIILVDDDSTDNSLIKCNEWVKKDKRIKVIHKKNGGVSSTRNKGLENVTGSIIGFVDSDDYIEPDMFEKLYNNYKEYNADISACSFNDEYLNGIKKLGKHFDEKIKILKNKEAIANLVLEQNITNHLWNKIYKKELFDGIVFPNGKKMEDLGIMYLLFEKANKLVFDNYVGYHYLQHNDSIMGKINKSLIDNYEEMVFKRNEYLLVKYPEIGDIIAADNLKTYKLLHYLAFLGNERKLLTHKNYKEYYRKYKKKYFKFRKIIKNNVGSKGILSYDLFWFSKRIYFMFINKKRVCK